MGIVLLAPGTTDAPMVTLDYENEAEWLARDPNARRSFGLRDD
jgi:hypothetical protein